VRPQPAAGRRHRSTRDGAVLDRLAKETEEHKGHMLPTAFSSHPANAERVAFFSQR